MTSRERVTRAITFESPDRIPVDLPEKWQSDFLWAWGTPDPGFKPTRQVAEHQWQDEWGCVWEKLPGDKTMGQVKLHPLTDYDMLADYPFPDFRKPERYQQIKKIIAGNDQEKFALVGIDFQPMHRLEYLRGHENGWADCLTEPDGLHRLLDVFADKAIENIDMLSELGGVDAIISADDWGHQDRLALSPETFREFFKPRFARVYKHAREKGLMTILHSCGYIIEILQDFKEAHLQVIQMDQQNNMGIDNLAREAGGKLCFWCPVDIQDTMINGSEEDVRLHARKLIDKLGCYNGGFMAGWYTSPEAAGHEWPKIEAMADEFTAYGKKVYSKDNG